MLQHTSAVVPWMNVLNCVYLYTSGSIYLGFPSFRYYEYSSYEQPHGCLCVDTCFPFSWGRFLRVELLGHLVSLCLLFYETTKLFVKWLHHLSFPPLSSPQGPSLPHPCQDATPLTFLRQPLPWVRSGITCGLVCISLVANDIEHIFTDLLVICTHSSGKYLLKPFVHF